MHIKIIAFFSLALLSRSNGSASSCILRVDLDRDLVIVQIRKTAGEKYGEYSEKFFMAIADSML